MIEKALLSRKIFVLWSCFCLCVCFRQSTVCHSFYLPSVRGWGSSRLLLPALCVDHEVGGPERGPGAPPAGRALARCWREVQPPPLAGVIKQALNVSRERFPFRPSGFLSRGCHRNSRIRAATRETPLSPSGGQKSKSKVSVALLALEAPREEPPAPSGSRGHPCSWHRGFRLHRSEGPSHPASACPRLPVSLPRRVSLH